MHVTSTRTRISSLGHPQSESVEWDGGSQGWPSGNNTSTSARKDNGTLTQKHSGKTITWSWYQNGRPEGPTTGPYYSLITSSLSFTAKGGTQTARYKIYYLKEGEEVQATELTHSVTVGVLYSEETRTWSESIDGTGLSIPCTQDRNTKVWKSNSPINLQFPAAGGTKEFTVTTWYEWTTHDDTFVPSINSQPKSITAEPNKTTTSKSWSTSYEQDGQTINVYCTQDAEAFSDWTYTFMWSNGKTDATGHYKADGTAKDSSYENLTIISNRSRGGSAGTQQTESVALTGIKGKPDGVNYSDSSRSDSGTITQADSGKTLTWSWSQDANEYVYGAECSALATYDGNGFFLHISNKTVSLTRAFKYGNDTQKQYDTEDAKYSESVPANPTVSEKTWTENYTASNGATYSVSYRQFGKLIADKTVTISVSSVSNTFAQYNVTFGASEALEKNITISYTITYKKESNQSFQYTSGSCVLESGSASVSDSGSLPISDIVPNSAYVTSMSASPSSYTNSYSGTTTISCDI